jgi:hypothetical protein
MLRASFWPAKLRWMRETEEKAVCPGQAMDVAAEWFSLF